METPRTVEIANADLVRAARILAIRSRRETTGLFAGGYVSAFRGGGIEFEESRPYVPGDDVRSIDWNATARRGEPYVKRFREERDRTVLLALDVSASMRFGSAGRAMASTAAHAAALLAVAAGRAGDRVGLLAFDESIRAALPPARGDAHIWSLIRTAVEVAERSGGRTRIETALDGLRRYAGRRAAILLFSDFRDEAILADGAGALRAKLVALARRHDLVAAILCDPRDERLPAAGTLRLADPERPAGVWVLHSSSGRARARYRAAAALRRRRLELALRTAGADLLMLRTDRDPLRALTRFFRERAARPRVAS